MSARQRKCRRCWHYLYCHRVNGTDIEVSCNASTGGGICGCPTFDPGADMSPPSPRRRPAPVTPRSGPSYIRGGKGV